MSRIARDYQENVETIIQSNLPVQKKQLILATISEQLDVLCDQHEVPDLTDKERTALRSVYAKTQIAVHKLEVRIR